MGCNTASSYGPVLAFDTSAAHCAAALFLDGAVVTAAQQMNRGQAETLMPLLNEILTDQGLRYSDLARLAVGVGPGNFTGIRIAVSAARGLAMALDIPAIGVSSFEAVLHGQEGRVAAISAPRDMAYLQKENAPPCLVALEEVPEDALWPETPAALVKAMAVIASQARADRVGMSPAPLYIRPASAAPPRAAPPVILNDAS
ncbi:MAG: tRNA (adenosine(37)-N6)-threonylcarbamoyltransferase complex dimerization subunit type 1 TsaB [Pseudomonadota bacterium]